MRKLATENQLKNIRSQICGIQKSLSFLECELVFLARDCGFPWDWNITKGHIIDFEKVNEKKEFAFETLQEDKRSGVLTEYSAQLADIVPDPDALTDLLWFLDDLFA